MPSKKSDRIHCEACKKDYAPSRLCSHLSSAKRQWSIKRKRERDSFSALYPSADPMLRYMEDRRRALPDDHDFDEFDRAFDFIEKNPGIADMICADIDDQLLDLPFASFQLAWGTVRRRLIRQQRMIHRESKFFMNDHLATYLSRLIQITRPQYEGKWRTRKAKADASYQVDYELGWAKSEEQPEQDSLPIQGAQPMKTHGTASKRAVGE